MYVGKKKTLTFDCSFWYAKFPQNEILIVLNNLAEFCFDGEENDCIILSTFGARWVKEIKGHSMS